MKCETCKFWDAHEGRIEPGEEDAGEVPASGYGKCRRYPPRTYRELPEGQYDYPGTDVKFWLLPCTEGDDWCGEWLQRDA